MSREPNNISAAISALRMASPIPSPPIGSIAAAALPMGIVLPLKSRGGAKRGSGEVSQEDMRRQTKSLVQRSILAEHFGEDRIDISSRKSRLAVSDAERHIPSSALDRRDSTIVARHTKSSMASRGASRFSKMRLHAEILGRGRPAGDDAVLAIGKQHVRGVELQQFVIFQISYDDLGPIRSHRAG